MNFFWKPCTWKIQSSLQSSLYTGKLIRQVLESRGIVQRTERLEKNSKTLWKHSPAARVPKLIDQSERAHSFNYGIKADKPFGMLN